MGRLAFHLNDGFWTEFGIDRLVIRDRGSCAFTSASLLLYHRLFRLSYRPAFADRNGPLLMTASGPNCLESHGSYGCPSVPFVLSQSPSLYIRFVSDDQQERRGWGGFVSFPKSCAGGLYWDTATGKVGSLLIGPYATG